jgi:hypothetical protein
MASDDFDLLIQEAVALLRDSPLVQLPEAQFPAGGDFSATRTDSSPSQWLIGDVVKHVRTDARGIVLFEDIISSPSDAALVTPNSSRAPFWYFANRIFWPVMPAACDADVELSFAWRAGFRVIAAFGRLPHSISPTPKDLMLTESDLREIAGSLARIVVDLWDGEYRGFVSWQRR